MNTILEQINSAGFVFVKFAVPMLVQSAVLIVVLLLADLLLRKKVRAVFRYWLWMLVLLKLILPTTLSSPVSLGSWLGDELATVKFSEMSTPTESTNLPQMIDTGTVAVTGTPQANVRPTVTRSSVAASLLLSPAPLTWQGIVFLVWVAVVVAMGLLLLQRAIFVTGLVAQAQSPTQLMNDAFRFCCGQMSIKGKVSLKVSANTASPAVCGLFRPVILVPQNLAPTLGSSRLRPVLLHELAHIKRGDLWTNLVQTILQIIYFYNPLLWLANFIIRRIREQAVDETVQVAMGANATQYPQTLVDVAKLAFNRPVLSLRLIGVVESESTLKRRIERMLNRPIPKTAKLGAIGLFALFIFAAVLLPMAKAKEKLQTETNYSSVTVQEGVGFDNIIVGDVNCTGEFIKSRFGEPDEEVKNEKDWWLNYSKTYGLGFWINPKENVLMEIRLNKGFKGKLTSGISISSAKQDVFKTYGKPVSVETVDNLTRHFDDHVLYEMNGGFFKPKNGKIFYGGNGLLFWFEGDEILQMVIHPKEVKADVQVDIKSVPYTQEMFNDIQPDGTSLFKTTIRQINQSDKEITSTGFINSDFVHVTDMSDAKGRPIKFTSTHEEDIYRYEVTFNEPVLPGEVMERTSEGTMEGLVKPVPASKDTFQYSMTHWPATNRPTRRVETYLLPAGAELVSTTPEDMQRRTKDERTELHVEKMIPAGGSITTAFQYRLTGGKELDKIVEQTVMTISTCAETDPRVEQSLKSLQGLDENAVVKKLVKFLDSDKNTVRRSAIYILWKGNFESIEPAVLHLQNLCSHEEEYTRGMAALALGTRKVEPAFDTLCNMTLNDSSAYARRCAAYALGLMGNPRAKDVLEKALKDSDFNVRNNAEAALTMLSQVEKPKSTQPETKIKDRGREKNKTEVQ